MAIDGVPAAEQAVCEAAPYVSASMLQDREAAASRRGLLWGALDALVALTLPDVGGRTATRRIARVTPSRASA